MKRKTVVIISVVVVVIAIVTAGATFAYSKYFGPQTVIQNNPDKNNCRQGNVLDGADSYVNARVVIFCKL